MWRVCNMSISVKRCQMAGFCWPSKDSTTRLDWPWGRKQCASHKRETNNFAIHSKTRSISSTSLVYSPERIDCSSSSSTVFAVTVMHSPHHSTFSLALSPAVVVVSSAGFCPLVVGASPWRLLGTRLRNDHRLMKWPLEGFLWLLRRCPGCGLSLPHFFRLDADVVDLFLGVA